jgi:hypothetical protein
VLVLVLVRIGAWLRFEHGFDGGELRAQTAQHLFQHVIAPDAQPVAENLNIRMTVAELPGERSELPRRSRRDLDQRFLLARNPYDRPIVKHETVAIAQRDGLRQIEQELRAAPPTQDDAAAMAFVGGKLNAIDHSSIVERARAAYR